MPNLSEMINQPESNEGSGKKNKSEMVNTNRTPTSFEQAPDENSPLGNPESGLSRGLAVLTSIQEPSMSRGLATITSVPAISGQQPAQVFPNAMDEFEDNQADAPRLEARLKSLEQFVYDQRGEKIEWLKNAKEIISIKSNNAKGIGKGRWRDLNVGIEGNVRKAHINVSLSFQGSSSSAPVGGTPVSIELRSGFSVKLALGHSKANNVSATVTSNSLSSNYYKGSGASTIWVDCTNNKFQYKLEIIAYDTNGKKLKNRDITAKDISMTVDLIAYTKKEN